MPGKTGPEGSLGGAAMTDWGETLGILGGGSRITAKAIATLYVQGRESIERDVLTSWTQ
jgi:hypothetical protein